MKGVKNNLKKHHSTILKLDVLINELTLAIDKEEVKRPWLNVCYTLLEKIRYNLLGCAALMKVADIRTTFHLPMGLLYRTILTDCIIFKYFRTVGEITQGKGFEIELDVLSVQFPEAIDRIYRAVDTQMGGTELTEFFKQEYKEFIKSDNNGKLKFIGADELQTPEHKEALQKHISDNKLNIRQLSDLRREGTKLEFLIDPNKQHIILMYSYFAQFHHYTKKAFNFYKKPDHLEANLRYFRDTLQIALGVCATIFKILVTENHQVSKKMDELFDDFNNYAAANDVYDKAMEHTEDNKH